MPKCRWDHTRHSPQISAICFLRRPQALNVCDTSYAFCRGLTASPSPSARRSLIMECTRYEVLSAAFHRNCPGSRSPSPIAENIVTLLAALLEFACALCGPRAVLSHHLLALALAFVYAGVPSRHSSICASIPRICCMSPTLRLPIAPGGAWVKPHGFASRA